MKNKDLSIASKFGILFDLTARTFSTHLTNKFNENGLNLTSEQYKVLIALFDKNGLSQQKIADVIGKDKTSVTRLIHGLEKRGLVSRKKSQADLRHRFIYLSEEGRSIENNCERIYREVIEDIFSSYDRKQIKEFRSYLKNVISSLDTK